MWPTVVVEIHDVPYEFPRLTRAFRTLHAVEPLLLDNAVYTFCYGIVRGAVVFRHADADFQPLETCHILVAAVLHAAVGVVDERLPVGIGPSLRNGLFQSFHRMAGLESFRERPPDDLAGVGIGDQVQIADSILRHDVRDVSDPQLIGGRRTEARLQEVLVLAVVMVGVRRMSAVQWLEKQVLYVHKMIEAVPAYHDAGAHVLKHQPKLVAAHAGAQHTQLMHHTYDS